MRPDLCITAAYGQYLTKRFLAMPKFGKPFLVRQLAVDAIFLTCFVNSC